MKAIWLLNLILYLIFNFIQYKYIQPTQLENEFDWILLIIDLFATCLTVLFVSTILNAIVSLIPFLKKRYWGRFIYLLPISILITLIIFLYAFGSTAYLNMKTGQDIRFLKKYDNVSTANPMDCERVKTGYFETDNLWIMRTENKQVQIKKDSSSVNEFEVLWKSPCEYQLIPLNDSKDSLNIKISDVFLSQYHCYIENANYSPLQVVKRINSISDIEK